MSEDDIAAKGNVRQLTLDLLRGALSAAPSRKASSSLALPTRRRGGGTGTADVLSRRLGSVRSTCGFGDDASDTEKEILLFDEVDVFFGSDFYGQTYNPVTVWEEPAARALISRIWAERASRPSLHVVQDFPEYAALLKFFVGDWRWLVDIEVRSMCVDCQSFNEPAYVFDAATSRVGYTDMDSVNWDLTYGYRTAFAVLHEVEQNGGRNAEASLRRALGLRVICGMFSYANIKPARILGVSGTLAALSDDERRAMRSFGLDLETYVPSVYGTSNFSHGPESMTGACFLVMRESTRSVRDLRERTIGY